MPAPLSRRTFLRGTGTLLALPFLNAMSPRTARAAERRDNKRRLITFNTTLGLHLPNFVPTESGRDYKATRYLEPFAALRDDMTVITGLSHPDVDGGHSAELSFLTAAPHPSAQSFRNTISLDQYAVEQLQPDTRLPFLVLAQNGGSSFTRSGARIPAEYSPSRLFASLFVDGTPAEVNRQLQRLDEGRSIMDTVLGQAQRLSKTLGPNDRDTLDQYLTSVRDVEKRLVASQDWAKRPKPRVEFAPPKDPTPSDLIGHQQLMLDLVRLSFATDSTRFVTMTYGSTGGGVPPIEGVSGEWHGLSHHGQSPAKIDQLSLIEMAEMRQLARFLTSLKELKEEGESLLDRTVVLYGSNLSNPSSHNTTNLPFLLAGGGFQHGQHLAFNPSRHPPLANLFVSVLQRLGVETNAFASGRSTLQGLELA